MQLEYSQLSTGEANCADEVDIDEFRSKSIDTFVKYLSYGDEVSYGDEDIKNV